MKNRTKWLLALIAAIMTPWSFAAGEERAAMPGGDLALGRKLARVLAPGLVEIHYSLRYDETGGAPGSIGIYCPNCHVFHGADLKELMADRRDLVLNGFLVAPDTVLAPDVMIAPEGYDAIVVKQGPNAVAARLEAYYPEYGGLRIRLEKPLPHAEPLVFNGSWEKPVYGLSRIMEMGQWTVTAAPFGEMPHSCFEAGGRISNLAPGNSLLVNADGKPVGLLLNNNEITEKMSLRQSWREWPEVSAEAWDAQLRKLDAHLRKALYPVTLYLRDLRLSRREKLQRRETDAGEINGVGFLLPDGKFFLPLLLTPSQSSRIERVVIRAPGGDQQAEIVGVLKHFGGIVLKPAASFRPQPLADGTARLSDHLGDPVWGAKLRVYGRTVTVKTFSDVLFGVSRGFLNRRFCLSIRDNERANLLFSPDGRLLAIEVGVRAFNYERRFSLLSAADLTQMLGDPAEILPFEAMTNRPDDVGFLGVEYQNLTPELAQAEHIADLTEDGRIGLLISFVYPDSPAAGLGLKAGDVLLKVLPSDGGAPITLSKRDFPAPEAVNFPWERLGDIPERFFDEIPEPWVGIKDPLNRLLTNIGIGKPVELLVLRGGKPEKLAMKVAAAPDYFEVAAEYQSRALGITVSDITFEVRRYFRMAPDAPGVVISGVVAGSPGATAGLRPFEIVTAVNDQPVRQVADFEKMISGRSEVRLTVRRLAAGRVVTVKIPAGPRR